MTCDKCKKDFYERDPSNQDYRRNSLVSFGNTGLELCTPCEKVTTVVEARELAQKRSAAIMAEEREWESWES